MKRWLILALVSVSCAGNRPPAHFLQTDSAAWNERMNAMAGVDLTGVPLGALSTRAPFQGLDIRLVDLDSEYRVTLQAERVSRRQALWMLAEKYGLSMTAVSNTVVITPRELRRPNVPLP
jgi:hypothetical protein